MNPPPRVALDNSKTSLYREYLNAELEAAAAYSAMAEAEKDPNRAKVFEKLVEAEMRHASRWAEKLGMDVSRLEPATTGWRLWLIRSSAKLVGTKRVIPWLLRGEVKEINAYASDPEARDLVGEERRHVRLLTELTDNRDPLAAMRSGRGYLFGPAGGLRAAVLGMNDGLVSNFSLVMGVAGGTGDADLVRLAGVLGLLAGAFSMSAGEYVSMRSQRDVYEHQIRAEQAEIEQWPEEEEEELVLIYQAKGLSADDSRRIAKQIMSNPQIALETMAREELGLDPSQLGSPWAAAISSFAAFVAGALVPILPYIFDAGTLAFSLSAVLSAGALLVVGGLLAGLTGRNAAWGGLRMLLAGGSAAAITFGVGHLIGLSVGG
jgi:VIT1/CCC1 family predicted Fe2+/Mn2+ transporter